MTGKRFKIYQDMYETLYIEDKETGVGICVGNEEDVKYNTVSKIVQLLNELHEEAKDNEHYHSEVLRLYKAVSEKNEQLKTKNNAYIQDIEVFKEENQSLKFQLDECQNHKLFSRRELEKENEHIKQTIKDMLENERTELGRSVLKQLWEQLQ